MVSGHHTEPPNGHGGNQLNRKF